MGSASIPSSGAKGGTDSKAIDLCELTGPVTVSYTGDEAGTITDGTDTVTFSQIEKLILTEQNDSLDDGANSAGMDVAAETGDDTLSDDTGKSGALDIGRWKQQRRHRPWQFLR